MGYGSRALQLLKQYYNMEVPSVEEEERPQEAIESIGADDVGLLEEMIGT
jgi:NADPH:quinone reductase-like Zn-dependent oxidoreductase